MVTGTLMAATVAYVNISSLRILPSSSRKAVRFVKPARCAPLQEQSIEEPEVVDAGIMCDSCNGKGWLLCDFCEGQKTNVRAKNNRIYRRCPSCRAIGYTLCPKCKVYKCVTFPNYDDTEEVKS